MKKGHILKAEKIATHEHEYFNGLGFNEMNGHQRSSLSLGHGAKK
jgi:hypothetical protein